jgi:predicted permease
VNSIGPILKVLVPIGIGIFLVQTRILQQEDSRTIRKLCVRFAIPLLVFTSLYKTELTVLSQVAPMCVALVAMSLALFGLGWTSALLVKGPDRRTAVHASIAFGNYGWIGWAASQVFFGDAGFQRAIFFTLLFWPALYVLGLPIGLIHAGREEGQKHWRLILGMAGPSLSALTLGAGMNWAGVRIPSFVYDPIQQFAAMAVPLILLSVGVQLEFRTMKSQLAPAGLISVARLVVGPAIGVAVLVLVRRTTGCDDPSAHVILLQSAMPIATLTPILADNYRMDLNVVGAAIVLSTLVSLVTIPVWVALMPYVI